MKRLAVLLTLALCFPLAAHADEASRHAKAEELVTLLHMDRLAIQVTKGVLQQTEAITTRKVGGTLTPEARTALANFENKLLAFTDPQISWKAIEPEYVRLYATGFTDEELDGILAFYKSPAGKALLEKIPALNDQASKLLETRFNALQPQLKQMLDQFEETLTPSPTAPASTPGTAPK